MMIPPAGFEGWKVWTVGDDIAWLKPDAEDRLRAINPESGFFGVAPGTSWKTNPNAMATLSAQHDIHERRAHARWGRVVGGDDRRAAGRVPRLARQGAGRHGSRTRPGPRPRTRTRDSRLRHHNARPSTRPGKTPRACRSARSFSAAAAPPRCRSCIRRSTGVPACISERPLGSEMTAAAGGVVGKVRRDPMAMLPFCGYHMGDYFRHWIRMQRALSATPRIFHVNWFRKDDNGQFIWPGFGENLRVLKWIIDRARGRTVGKETPIGWMPRYRRYRMARARFPPGEVRAIAGLRPQRLAGGSARTRRALHRVARPATAGNGV